MISPAWISRSERFIGILFLTGLRANKSSPVEFASNHVDRPEGWNHVGDHVAGQNFVQSRHDRKARWTDPHAVRIRGSIAHDVEPELHVGPFNRKVGLALRPPHAV